MTDRTRHALVTGSAGFVGRHMTQRLRDDGWWVTECDFKTGQDARSAFRNRDPRIFDLVIHCAYHVGGRARIDGRNHDLVLNQELDAAMFRWSLQTGQRRVVYFSSSAVYPVELQTRGISVPHVQLTEDDVNLDDPEVRIPDADYGWAKYCGERMARRAAESGLAVHILRPFSGYGEDQNPDEYPFPAIIRRVRTGDLTVWGPPGQLRDWIHIDDVIAGTLAVVDADVRLPVNLCSGVPTEMGHLARLIHYEVCVRGFCSAPGPSATHGPIRYDESKPTGVFARVGDPTRMLDIYKPKITLTEGIRRAVDVIARSTS